MNMARLLAAALLSLAAVVSALAAEPFDGNIAWTGGNGVTVDSATTTTSPVYSGQFVDVSVAVSGTVSGPVTVFLYYQRLCYYSAGGHQATHDVMIGYTTLSSLSGSQTVTIRGVAPFQVGWNWGPSGDVLYIIKTRSPTGYAYGANWWVSQQAPVSGITGAAAGTTGPEPTGLTSECTISGGSIDSITDPVTSGQMVDASVTITGSAAGKIMVGLYYQRLTDHGPGHQATQDVLIGYRVLPSLSGSATVSLSGASPFEVGWDELPSGNVLYIVKVSTATNYAGLDGSGNVISPLYVANTWVSQEVPTSGTTGGGGGTPPPPGNAPPVARAGADLTIEDLDNNGSEQASFNGSGSTDSDGAIQSYVWREGGTQLATGATAQVSLARGTHTITLTVTDDDGATGTDSIVVRVVNFPPIANAGADLTVRDDNLDDMATVTLDGTGSSDPSTAGSISSYVWTKAGVQIAVGASAQVSLLVGVHTITLTVTDNEGAQASDTVRITVSFQDDDSDGMSDAWELRFFSDISEDPTGDPDGDGASNLAEFIGGSDPTDPASKPPEGVAALGFSCAPGGPAGPGTASFMLFVVLAALAVRTRLPVRR